MTGEKKSVKGLRQKADAQNFKRQAEQWDRLSPGRGNLDLADARRLEAEADLLLEPPQKVEIGAGREVIPNFPDGIVPHKAYFIKDTLKEPDQVSVDASHTRMELAYDARVLDMAVDAANSIDARNSLEKMLAHQMAACHDQAMTLLSLAFDKKDPVDIQRLINASARLMKTYNEGLQTFQKLRTGGRQEVIVQHVHVTDGGQAVVTGQMKTSKGEDNTRGVKDEK